MVPRITLLEITPLLAATLCLCGCVVEATGPTQHDSRSIDLDASERVTVDLNMGAGHLRVDGGTQKLARADFTYNVASWKPYVRYRSAAGHGTLSIEQPSGGHAHMGASKYEWDLRLNREVPVDMRVHFGAGDADLNLGSLSLRSVEVEMGVGKLNLDLRGNPKRNYDVRIRGGVGEATVRVPGDVGVYGEAEGGIGEIRTTGLHQEGRRYFNSAYEHSKVTIHLDIRGGIGSIRVISD
ncbi:conserved exported hypothetical protein [Candidatus Sulfopaludibacter sp. SbA6]|nr:conserved exported hypothetical protein [Candidatus Sulfopaludibacter sp. SbA6]